MFYRTKGKETPIDITTIKDTFGLPDYTYQLIEDEENERTVHITRLKDEYKMNSYKEYKT